MTSLDEANGNIRQMLRSLAQQAGFNLVLDDSVTGDVTLTLENVSINQALDALTAMSGVEIIPKSGNIFLAIQKEAAAEKGLSRQFSKVIPVRYSNAQRLAGTLNVSLFAADTTNSSQQAVQKIQADSRTNSLIVLGTPREIQQVEDAVEQLDLPRQSKTFQLSHANALDIATILSSSVFNDGINPLSLGGGGSGGGSSSSSKGGSASSSSSSSANSGGGGSPLRVESESVKEGSGTNDFGGSAGDSASTGQSVTLRGYVKTSSTVNVSSKGVMVIPDTRLNTVTILGTPEQIAMAERMIPVLDAQLPQVAIEASLIEISDEGTKELGAKWGVADGKFQFGFNNEEMDTLGTNATTGDRLIGIPTVDNTNNLSRTAIGFTTNPVTHIIDYVGQIRALVNNRRAKLLANPNIVATHDTESVISIVDEIVRRVVVSIDSGTGVSQVTTELGEAGIVLNILPKVGEDGMVTMRIRPSVTSVRGTSVVGGNTVTLLNKRDLLTQQVRISDGQTLVLGGLIKETSNAQTDKLPGIGDLPIVGAMFRAARNNTTRTELVLLITPHILNKTLSTPVSTNLSSPLAQGGVK